jgi:hypothetical protein
MLDPTFPERRTNAGWNLQTHGSGLIEQVLEYQFLAALTPELLRRGARFEVLRGDFDLDGHDLVIEAGGITRHIQLKGIIAGGTTREVQINTALRTKTSGCVVLMTYDPVTLDIIGWRWFGGAPGAPLPNLGDRVGKHSKANKDGVKAERPNIRLLRLREFTSVEDTAQLADRLFGPEELMRLRSQLRTRAEPAEGWLAAVQAGAFEAIPQDLGWEGSVELAHLIDGYDLAEQLGIEDPFEYAERQLAAAESNVRWSGNALELWITLFLEHRRWKFSSPMEPEREMQALLDRLVLQLRDALTAEVR